MIDRLGFDQSVESCGLSCLPLLLSRTSAYHILPLKWNTSLFLFVTKKLLMKLAWHILDGSHVLNLWNNFAISHVLKYNLRVANYDRICNIDTITIDSTVCIVSNILSYIWLHSLLFTTIMASITHLHRILRLQWSISVNDLLSLLSTHHLWNLMQLTRLIISYTRVCSKMLFRILGTRFLTFDKIVIINRLKWLHF